MSLHSVHYRLFWYGLFGLLGAGCVLFLVVAGFVWVVSLGWGGSVGVGRGWVGCSVWVGLGGPVLGRWDDARLVAVCSGCGELASD